MTMEGLEIQFLGLPAKGRAILMEKPIVSLGPADAVIADAWPRLQSI